MLKRFLISSVLCTLAHAQAYSQVPVLVSDIAPGATGSEPQSFIEFNSKLFFSADASTRRLYQYSGDAAPTVANAIASPAYSKWRTVLQAGEKLFIIGTLSGSDYELLSYTSSGLLQSHPTASSTIDADQSPVYAGDKIWMSSGTELLWYKPATNESDFVDLGSGVVFGDSDPRSLCSIGNKVYAVGKYTASSGPTQYKVYEIDAITNSVTPINPDISYYPSCLRVKDGELYMISNSRLSKFIGGDIVALSTTPAHSTYDYEDFGFLGECIYFFGPIVGASQMLYRYNTTTSITTPLSNFDIALHPNHFTEYNNVLYFTKQGSYPQGVELWSVTNSTNPALVADINTASSRNSNPEHLYVWDGALYFSATNGTLGQEFYRLGNPSSVQNIFFDSKIKVSVSPNPVGTTARINISNKTPIDLSIRFTDALGRTVREQNARHFNPGEYTIEIPVDALASGTYFCSVYSAQGALLWSGKIEKN